MEHFKKLAIGAMLAGMTACTHSLEPGARPESERFRRVRAGYTWTHHPPPPAADAVLAGRGISIQNTHIMGWGPDNPNPKPGTYDFSSLDLKIERMRAASGPRTRLMITFCTAPGWMKVSGEDWAMEDRVAGDRFGDFAALCRRVAERYPDVRYFQVWNEMKGFYDANLNRWQYEDYTEMYNLVWKAVKKARPDALIGGPYVVMDSGSHAARMSHPSDIEGGWGVIDRRALDVLDYFLENAVGYDFVCVDGGIENRFGDEMPLSPLRQIDKFLACLKYIRAKTPKLLVWSETYVIPSTALGRPSDEDDDLFIELLRRTESQIAGETRFLIWGGRGFSPQPVDYSNGRATRLAGLLDAREGVELAPSPVGYSKDALKPQSPARFKHFTPGAPWPDDKGVHVNAHGGGFLFHKGVYYWFGEHKIEGREGNRAHVGVHAYSSTDLYNWKDEGIALAVSEDPASPIVKGCVIERPKVIYNARTGKFVMWFHLELVGQKYNAALSGVAESDSVTGPYRFIEAFRPNGQMARDMTLFVDDDGRAYHLFASEHNATMHVSLLSDDYLKPSGKYERILIGRSTEAPAVCKHEGKYYLVVSHCTGWRPNPAISAVADSIMGPWTETGNPCIGTEEQMANTFESQSTYILPVNGKTGAFIFMADRWRPENAIDGRYVWLPVQFREGRIVLEWLDSWDLGFFDRR